MENQKDIYAPIAYKILLEIGAIKECPIHGSEHYYETDVLEKDQIYKLANSRIKKEINNIDYVKFDSVIQSILDQASPDIECPWCEKF